jgi:hypothetical protein
MKLKIIFTVFLFSIAVRLIQAQTVNELFVSLPESAFLTLPVSDRLDLIDMYKGGEKATVKNLLGDSCSILSMTDNYLQFRIGKNTMELFLLQMINDSKIVGLIQTVCAPVCDSRIEFYTTTWKKLDTSVFISLAGKYDFLKEGIHPEEENIKNALVPLDISLMQLHYDSEKRELQQIYTTPDYLSETDRDKVMPYLSEIPKLFKWNLTRFE